MLLSTVTLAAFLGGSAIRNIARKTEREAGQIDGLFPIAAVPSAQPGLWNARGGPCFPGVRSANVRMRWFGQEADTATTVTQIFGYGHPWLDVQLNDVDTPEYSSFTACRSGVKEMPYGFSNFELHDSALYTAQMQNKDLGWGNLLYTIYTMALPLSYELDKSVANQTAQDFGYEIIGSALDGGSSLYVGDQVSHLFQDKVSKECILTFQGTTQSADWTANANVDKVRWCGLSSQDAHIDTLDAWATLPDGESLVHEGFKDALMFIVNSSDWQSDIRPKLSSCSKLYVTGHSQGGSQAELFAACVQKAPGAGQYGYGDYMYMEF